MEPIYAKCNSGCNHNFYVKHFKTDKLNNGIEKTYFNCPNCKQEHVCFYTDVEVRNLQKKQRELRRKLKWRAAGTHEGDKLIEELTKLQSDTKKRMEAIKEETEQLEQEQ